MDEKDTKKNRFGLIIRKWITFLVYYFKVYFVNHILMKFTISCIRKTCGYPQGQCFIICKKKPKYKFNNR